MKEFLPTYVPKISESFYHEKKEGFHNKEKGYEA